MFDIEKGTLQQLVIHPIRLRGSPSISGRRIAWFDLTNLHEGTGPIYTAEIPD